eukprot:Gb_04131 [translate_table: standard]
MSCLLSSLSQKGHYTNGRNATTSPSQRRGHGLCLLISVLACAEGVLISTLGSDGAQILDWLVDASAGGGGLGLQGAAIAAEVWPRLVSIPMSRRGELLKAPLFAVAAKEGTKVAVFYPQT